MSLPSIHHLLYGGIFFLFLNCAPDVRNKKIRYENSQENNQIVQQTPPNPSRQKHKPSSANWGLKKVSKVVGIGILLALGRLEFTQANAISSVSSVGGDTITPTVYPEKWVPSPSGPQNMSFTKNIEEIVGNITNTTSPWTTKTHKSSIIEEAEKINLSNYGEYRLEKLKNRMINSFSEIDGSDPEQAVKIFVFLIKRDCLLYKLDKSLMLVDTLINVLKTNIPYQNEIKLAGLLWEALWKSKLINIKFYPLKDVNDLKKCSQELERTIDRLPQGSCEGEKNECKKRICKKILTFFESITPSDQIDIQHIG